VEAGFRGPGRDTQDKGRLCEGQPEIEMQDHDRALGRVERSKASLDLIAIEDRRPRLERQRRVLRTDHALDARALPLPPGHAVAGAHGQAVRPGLPRDRFAQGPDVTPGQDRRFLESVLGCFRVTEDEARQGEHPIARVAGEVGEGVMIAIPSPFHEVALHRGSLRPRRLRCLRSRVKGPSPAERFPATWV
jgi:hypothetical protein